MRLGNPTKIASLFEHPADPPDQQRLLDATRRSLADARRRELAPESRFDLAEAGRIADG